jgi:peptidyl-Lys metalloendopeptidase
VSRIARALTALPFAALFACAGPSDDATLAGDTSQSSAEIRQDNSGLSATISASRSTFDAADPVTVTLTITNGGKGALQLLRWFGPTAELEEHLFAVARDGKAVQYIGPHMKRAAPDHEDMLTIAPGRSVSAEVSLSGAYDFSATGAYTVRYELGKMVSNELTFWVEGRQTVWPAPLASDIVTLGTITYTSCSASQQSQIPAALSQATTYATASLNYLTNTTPSGTPRYTTWFGTFSSSGWNKAKADYAAIQDAFLNKNMGFDCSCKKKGVYAFVYPNQPYNIHLCPVFWQVANSGTDSRGGTLVHETSHFTVVAGTNDFAYGQNACKSLALSNPTQALGNADSHEYFAENTPSQN